MNMDSLTAIILLACMAGAFAITYGVTAAWVARRDRKDAAAARHGFKDEPARLKAAA